MTLVRTQENAGARAFRDMWRVKMHFTLNGAQRLRVLNQLEPPPEERLRQQRVPFAPGPREGRNYFLLETVSVSDSQRRVHSEPAVLREGLAEA